MTKIGYACMLEQFHPTDLLDWAERAEAAGFSAGFQVSEHFHPWTPTQGQAAFAWSFMGALGQRTSLPFGVGVTCPGFRYHPAVIAHAAATLGAMYPGRFWLGLGAGEALNEHIVGGEWPEVGVRSAMLFEAVELIAAGKAPAIAQDESKATYEAPCRDEHARVDFARPAREGFNLVRGCDPQPGAYADLDGNLLIANDPFSGVKVEGGKLMLPDRPGLGLKPASASG